MKSWSTCNVALRRRAPALVPSFFSCICLPAHYPKNPCSATTCVTQVGFLLLVKQTPEAHARYGAVAGPRLGEFLHLFWRGFLFQAEHFLESFLDTEVAGGQDIGPRERKHQKHLRRPLAYPLQRHDVLNNFRIGHCG